MSGTGPDATMSGTTTLKCVICGPKRNLDAKRDRHEIYILEDSGWWDTYEVLVCPGCQASLTRGADRDVSRDENDELHPRMGEEVKKGEYWQLVTQRALQVIKQERALNGMVVKIEK